MTELSPAAQACVAAWVAAQRRQTRTAGRREALAAFAEALADQVVPEGSVCMVCMPETDVDGNDLGGMLLTTEPNDRIRRRILAIAAELRGESITKEAQP